MLCLQGSRYAPAFVGFCFKSKFWEIFDNTYLAKYLQKAASSLLHLTLSCVRRKIFKVCLAILQHAWKG